MAQQRARVIYAFEAASDVELNLTVGDILVVTRTDVGGGWWEGRKGGILGLFPENYVELLPIAPTMPKPPPRRDTLTSLPIGNAINNLNLNKNEVSKANTNTNTAATAAAITTSVSASASSTAVSESGTSTSRSAPPSKLVPKMPVPAQQEDDDDDTDGDMLEDDEEMDYEEEHDYPSQNWQVDKQDAKYFVDEKDIYEELPNKKKGGPPPLPPANSQSNFAAQSTQTAHIHHDQEHEDDDDDDNDNTSVSGSARVASPIEEKPYRITEGPKWEHTTWPVTVMVGKPEKKSKFSGMRQFTSYHVTSSSMKTAVSRRYKHFNWLHNRLAETFPCISIPPLPEKVIQANFKFEDGFIEKRRRGLERFLNRVAVHPVLGTSNVFLHFLTAAEKANWKSGKRSAEREAETSSFIETMHHPPNNVPDHRVLIVERFAKTVKNLDKHVHYLHYTCEHFQNKRNELKTEYGKLSFALRRLAHNEKEKDKDSRESIINEPLDSATWCWRDDCEECAPLIKGFDMMNIGVGRISTVMDQQKLNDTIPLMEFLKDYNGILKTYPAIIKTHENAVDAYNQAMIREKDAPEVISNLRARSEKISNITLSEFEHFHQQRLTDFKDMMDSFIQEQVAFHKKIASMWEEMLPYFGEIASERV